MLKRTGIPTVIVILLAATVFAATIAPGEVRTVSGTVSAVDVAAGALVVEVPVEAGMLTVGVTMDREATITRAGKPIELSGLRNGEKVTLQYTRRADRMIGLEVKAR